MFPRFPNPNPSAPEPLLPERGWQVPVVGWRTWRARASDGRVVLEGVHSGVHWDCGTTHADCPKGRAGLHPIPAASCDCGLFAFSGPDDALHYLVTPSDTLDWDDAPLVAGAVIAWGRIVPDGQHGWRAQHARPVALLDSDNAVLEALALRHRVPLVSARGLRLLPLEYGEVLKG